MHILYTCYIKNKGLVVCELVHTSKHTTRQPDTSSRTSSRYYLLLASIIILATSCCLQFLNFSSDEQFFLHLLRTTSLLAYTNKA
jgi:hypothetical protein